MEQHQQKEGEEEPWATDPRHAVSPQPSPIKPMTGSLTKTPQKDDDEMLHAFSLSGVSSSSKERVKAEPDTLTINLLLSNYNVFVISEENMTQCQALLRIDPNATVMCSFFSDEEVSEELQSKFEGVKAVFTGVNVLTLGNKARCVHPLRDDSLDLPFIVPTPKPWALWYHGAYAQLPLKTDEMLKGFLNEASRVLRTGDYVLIGWSLYYESKFKSYCIDNLITVMSGEWRVEAENGISFYDAIAAKGYEHKSNNQNGKKLWRDCLPKKTLILQRI